jgi:hypothetical protein
MKVCMYANWQSGSLEELAGWFKPRFGDASSAVLVLSVCLHLGCDGFVHGRPLTHMLYYCNMQCQQVHAGITPLSL